MIGPVTILVITNKIAPTKRNLLGFFLEAGTHVIISEVKIKAIP